LVSIRNNNPVPIHLFRADVSWSKIPPSRYLEAMQFHTSAIQIMNDVTPDTAWVPAVPIEVAAGVLGNYVAYFKPVAEPLQGANSVSLEFEDSCVKSVSGNLPTSTITPTPTITNTPTATPTPDCSDYTLSSFTFSNSAVQQLTVFNGDVVDAEVYQIQFNWNFAEQYGVINGYPNLNVDWFQWSGSYFHLGINGDFVVDYSSPSNWTSPLPSSNLPFNSGSVYTWQIDFDGDWAGGGPLPDVVSNDFGVIIDFTNGCQLRRDPVPRAIVSWTPSLTPTITYTPTPPPPPTATALPTITPLPTSTPLPTWTPTKTLTPTITPSPSVTPTPTATPLPTSTPVPTDTPDWAATATASSPTPLPTIANTPTNTVVPTNTPIWYPE
jgi:hypothetical protein